MDLLRRILVTTAALLAVGASPAAATAAAADSHVISLSQTGLQPLDGGYERVNGVVRGVVSGSEKVRGLPAAGLEYTTEYELIRPVTLPHGRLLVEAENRGSPLLLNAVSPGTAASGPPSGATYPASVSRFLRTERMSYARVQWQTGLSAGVPQTAQGVGEVIVRDFGRSLAHNYSRRSLIGVSQGAFFVDTFLDEGFNALPGGGRAYDQALTVDGNGNWMAINQRAGTGAQDSYLRPDGRPLAYARMLRRPRTDPLLVDVANYTDFYRLRAGLTSAAPALPQGVRRYDWPSPHQSFAPEVVFGLLGCNGGTPVPLSPLRNGPYLRGLLRAMGRGRLPASRRFALGRAPAAAPGFNALPGVDVRVPRTSHGQPVGGVRFPEVELPLGRLTPVSLSPSVTTGSLAVCGNSGGFAPFSPATITSRYSRAQYLRRYDRALDPLVHGGYVQQADRAAMLTAAAADYDSAVADEDRPKTGPAQPDAPEPGT